jgi:hypothetical protein
MGSAFERSLTARFERLFDPNPLARLCGGAIRFELDYAHALDRSLRHGDTTTPRFRCNAARYRAMML